MPQFDPTFFASQLVWLVIFFALLYKILSKSAIPQISEVLERRQKTMDDNFAKARRYKEESDAALAKYEADLAAAREAAHASIKAAADKAKAGADARSRAKAEDLDGKLAKAEKRIMADKDKALAEVDTLAADVTRHAIDKLIGVKVQTKTAEKAVATIRGE